MDMGLFGFGDIVLLIFVILFSYFFSSMWKVLYGNPFPRAIWKWGKDIKTLGLLASHADSDAVRQKSRFILNGIYFSIGFLLVGLVVGTFLQSGLKDKRGSRGFGVLWVIQH